MQTIPAICDVGVATGNGNVVSRTAEPIDLIFTSPEWIRWVGDVDYLHAGIEAGHKGVNPRYRKTRRKAGRIIAADSPHTGWVCDINYLETSQTVCDN